MTLLSARCRELFLDSRPISATINEIYFLFDLEAGIRAAWRADRVAGPARKQLLTVCCGLHPVLQNQKSFVSLLEELPDFAIDFLKALLGCAGVQAGSSEFHGHVCYHCKSSVLGPEQGDGKQFHKDAFLWTPFSVSIYSGNRIFYCSKECYNKGRIAWKYPDKPKEAQKKDASSGVI